MTFTEMKVVSSNILSNSNTSPSGGPQPIWIRAPKSGNEPYTGLSTAKLYDLARRGEIKSVSIRHPGQIKGTRLFHLGSILRFIDQTYFRQQKKQNQTARPRDEKFNQLLSLAEDGNEEAITDLFRDYAFEFGEDRP